MENEENKVEEKTVDPQEHFGQQMDEILSEKSDDSSEIKDNKQKGEVKDESNDSQDESLESSEEEINQDNQEKDETDSTDNDQEAIEILKDFGLGEDTIKQIVKESPELLESIKEEIKNPTPDNNSDEITKLRENKVTPKSNFKEIKVNLDPDLVGADVKSAIDSIVAQINQQGKTLESETQKLQVERDNAFQSRIDSHFDKFSKQVPDLGYSSTLTENQYKSRIKLFRHAMVTSEIDNVPIEKAIEIEVNKHRNQDSEQVASQKLIDKLNRQKKHFTNPPTRRNSSDLKDRKFATEEERKMAVMTEGYKQAGIEE